jgi:hypothetical protein
MMKSTLLRLLPVQLVTLALISSAWAAECAFNVEKITRITYAGGKSQTARDNARCIAIDAKGTAHMVWTDDRDGNVEIYYATLSGDKVASEVRLTNTLGESSFPCIALQGDNVYVLWQETVSGISQIFLLHLLNGKEVARKKLTSSLLGAGCPVSALGPDGALHIAWHDGTGSMTAVYYGKIVGDSLVNRTEICAKHAGAFRPDIAVGRAGEVLLAWYEGLEIKSKLWDGKAWGDEVLAATNDNREWRLSLTAMSLPASFTSSIPSTLSTAIRLCGPRLTKSKTCLWSRSREARTHRAQRMHRLWSRKTSGCEASTLRSAGNM